MAKPLFMTLWRVTGATEIDGNKRYTEQYIVTPHGVVCPDLAYLVKVLYHWSCITKVERLDDMLYVGGPQFPKETPAAEQTQNGHAMVASDPM